MIIICWFFYVLKLKFFLIYHWYHWVCLYSGISNYCFVLFLLQTMLSFHSFNSNIKLCINYHYYLQIIINNFNIFFPPPLRMKLNNIRSPPFWRALHTVVHRPSLKHWHSLLFRKDLNGSKEQRSRHYQQFPSLCLLAEDFLETFLRLYGDIL